ncbi:MAG: Cys-tRNA(Pro) deacylase [Christensenellales bacterium]
MGKEEKTNAMRMLDKASIPYVIHNYESDGFIDGITLAEKLGQPAQKTFKTLVTQGRSGEYLVFVIPVAKELDMKKAAKTSKEKSIQMVPVKDITKITGYVRGGCSPIGMKKAFKTFVDASAQMQLSIFFSGGRLGAEIEAAPDDLLSITGGSYADLLMD